MWFWQAAPLAVTNSSETYRNCPDNLGSCLLPKPRACQFLKGDLRAEHLHVKSVPFSHGFPVITNLFALTSIGLGSEHPASQNPQLERHVSCPAASFEPSSFPLQWLFEWCVYDGGVFYLPRLGVSCAPPNAAVCRALWGECRCVTPKHILSLSLQWRWLWDTWHFILLILILENGLLWTHLLILLLYTNEERSGKQKCVMRSHAVDESEEIQISSCFWLTLWVKRDCHLAKAVT